MKKNKLIVLLLLTQNGVLSKLKKQTPRSEYPRPQLERLNWINLNGTWSYVLDSIKSGIEKKYPQSHGFENTITVPFAPESKLSGVAHTDFIFSIWYHRLVTIPPAWEGKKILLHFGAVYYESEIYIDGTLVTRHFGGSSSFEIDVSLYATPGKSFDLVLQAKSDLRGGKQSAGKQSLQNHPGGCSYTRTTGIWQTVWMEAVSDFGIQKITYATDIDQKQLLIKPAFYNLIGSNKLEIKVKEGNKIIATKTVGVTGSAIVLPIPDMKVWSPENPFLYNVELRVKNSKGKTLDLVSSYTGMRKVHIEGNKIFLNNKPYYQRLVLDQGFYPEGNWTAPNDDALKNDIILAKQAGFNGARLHQKVFEPRYHYWADKLGYLTWGEASSWGMDCNDVEVARNFISEWKDIVVRDCNHPSIIIWTPINEAWWPDTVQYPRFIEDIYTITKQLDDTRPVNTVSGGVHVKTDIWTVHSYEQDAQKLKQELVDGNSFKHTPNFTQKEYIGNIGFNSRESLNSYNFPVYRGDIPYLIDEFGGIKWAPNETRNDSWGYGDEPDTEEEFFQRLESQINAILSLNQQVWGYCYTQLTDVEQEQNGIYYYNRLPKFDIKRLYAIFSKEPPLQVKPLNYKII